MPFDKKTRDMIAHILGDKISKYTHPHLSFEAKMNPQDMYNSASNSKSKAH